MSELSVVMGRRGPLVMMAEMLMRTDQLHALARTTSMSRHLDSLVGLLELMIEYIEGVVKSAQLVESFNYIGETCSDHLL